MTLPRLTAPEFETVIPSSKEKIKFRPFLVKEEKILYMALESRESNDIKNALLSVIDSCILTPGIDVEKFATYDVEYLFLRIRAKSVGEVINLNLKHQNGECQHETPYQLNLENIEVMFNKEHRDKIDLGNNIGIKMKMPSLNKVLSLQDSEGSVDGIFNLILNSIEYVYDNDNIYEEFTEPELKEFLESLTQDQFTEIQKFFDTLPKLYHDITWKCENCGKTETVRLEGLRSFFT
jgi:hypothetical protein